MSVRYSLRKWDASELRKKDIISLPYPDGGSPKNTCKRKMTEDDMKVEDGGATFSLTVNDQPLTLRKLNILQGLDGVERVLTGNNTFTVVFKVDSFRDITASVVVNAQQVIKKALYDNEQLYLSLSK